MQVSLGTYRSYKCRFENFVTFDPKPWAYPLAKGRFLDGKNILLKTSNGIKMSENVPIDTL